MAEGDIYFYNVLPKKAQLCYEQALATPEAGNNDTIRLQLLKRLMCTYDKLRDDKNLPEATYDLYSLAMKCGDSAYVALSRFMHGKRAHFHGEKGKGYESCLGALRTLEHSSYAQKNEELCYGYAELASMYLADRRFDEALKMSYEQERLARAYDNTEVYGMADRAMRRVYAIRTSILAEAGRMAEADSTYALFKAVPGKLMIVTGVMLPYFKKRKLYDEAMGYLKISKQQMRDDGDTLGYNIVKLLGDEGGLLYSKGDYRGAADCYAKAMGISDIVNSRTSFQLTASFRGIVERDRNIARHDLMLAIVIGVLILLVVAGILSYLHGRKVRRKNKSMMRTIRELMYSREQSLKGEELDNAADETLTVKPDSDYKERFKKMDREVMQNMLFLNPDFGRDDLMRLMGVDKNVVSAILNSCAGTNVIGYINAKRMEHAVVLMKEHPEYAISAIAEECGIKSQATFIRNFRNAYGMTPSEFRRNLV